MPYLQGLVDSQGQFERKHLVLVAHVEPHDLDRRRGPDKSLVAILRSPGVGPFQLAIRDCFTKLCHTAREKGGVYKDFHKK